jgi:hypothetical protein
MRRLAAPCLALVVALAACADPPSPATAPEEISVSLRMGGGNASTHMTGDAEVPPRETPAQGQAVFRVNADETAIEYSLNVANIDNVIMAHIHLGPPTCQCPIAVWLTDGPPPFASGGGPFDGRLADGTITAADLTGPMAGKTIAEFVAEMRAGNTYVNVHTNDGVAPTNTGPGDFPGGEVRGQIARGSLFQ